MIKFWLNVTEDPVTNMEKRVEMGVMVDDVKKQSMTVVSMNQVSKDVVKYRIRTEMMKLFLEELDSYLDNAFGNDFMPIGEVFEAAAIATHSAEVIAKIKQDHSPELFQKVLEMRNAQMDEALKCALHHDKSFLGLRTIRTKRDLEKATERRVLAECEVDDYIKKHKEDFK